MRNFTTLFRKLEESTDQKIRMDILINYFTVSTDEEITTAIKFLSGNRPKRIIDISTLKTFLPKITSLPQWLIEESYVHSGDWTELISLLIKPGETRLNWSLAQWIGEVERLRSLDNSEKMETIIASLKSVSRDERYFLIKLFAGGTRLRIATGLLNKCREFVSGVPQVKIENESQDESTIHTVTAVLLYVKFGRGTGVEYTFAAKGEMGLLPFTRIFSKGELDYDIEVSAFVKQNTVEKFGPVISIKPELIFEIELVGINSSSRHKCGIKVISPRIIRLSGEHSFESIVTVEYLRSLIPD